MARARYGCLTLLIATSIAGALLLYLTRYKSIERGLRLQNFEAGHFRYDAWSYGTWKTHHEGTLTIETYEPPYTLVIAIRPDDSSNPTIELVRVELVDDSGTSTSVIEALSKPVDDVKMRPGAIVEEPYAVFVFKDLLQSHKAANLEIEFRVIHENSTETVTRKLTIPAFEKVRHSFTFFEALMSV